MKGLVFDGTDIVYRTDLPMPDRAEGEVLVKVTLAAICNTDREILCGYKGFTGILGHEFTGIVEDEGNFKGKRVVGEINLGCGVCEFCKKGLSKHCTSRRALGISGKDGCFAEYVTLPARFLHEIPVGMTDETAIFTEPLAAATNAVSQANLKDGESVLILGDGRLAYMIYFALLGQTSDITVMGLVPEKLLVFSAHATTVTETERRFDVVIEATGSNEGINFALDRVKAGGRVVLKSTTAERSIVDVSRIVVNEITLIGSRCGDFDVALGLLEKMPAPLPRTEFFSLSEYRRAFASTAFKAGFKLL
jgi:Threonine dehydrogenase and related Zn-dependent dehydrogenases